MRTSKSTATSPAYDVVLEETKTLTFSADANIAGSVIVTSPLSIAVSTGTLKGRGDRVRIETPILTVGGDNNRATETPPGAQPLWIGLRRMTDFATAWLAFGPQV